MEHLFSSFRIRGIELKNRIVMPSIASFFTDKEGGITDLAVEHYRRRAAGGPAMVMMEACAVSPEGIVSPNQSRIYDDRHIEEVAKIARVIEEEGSIPAIQIHHGGRQTSPRVMEPYTGKARIPWASDSWCSTAVGSSVSP